VVLLDLGYEADVDPLSQGSRDGKISVVDWQAVGAYVAGLEQAETEQGTFQRADCAPRSLLGNGKLSLSDWVQAGRYAAGLDPVTAVGGPVAPQSTAQSDFTADSSSTRRLELLTSKGYLNSGETGVVQVSLQALGDENALSFSLEYDSTLLIYQTATLAEGIPSQTQLVINSSKLASGKIGFMLALPSGTSFAAGNTALLAIQFKAASIDTLQRSTIHFTSQPVSGEVVSPLAETLAAPECLPADLMLLPAGMVPGLKSSPAGLIRSGCWNLVSIPYEVINPDPVSVFAGIDLTWCSLQYWLNDRGVFQGFGSSFGWTGPIERGVSYWMLGAKMLSDCGISFQGVDPISNFNLTFPGRAVAPYWIMFGTPFPSDVLSENVRFLNTAVSPDAMTWKEAIDANMVDSKALGFDSSTQQFFAAGIPLYHPDRSALQPWYGYWLLVDRPETLTIQFPKP
jgi:hypothetical protein